MLEFYRKKGAFEAHRTQLMWYVARHCAAWINKVKTLSGYSRTKALQEVLGVADRNFNGDWIKSGIIEESFGHRVQKGIMIARLFQYRPIVWFWNLVAGLRRMDGGIERVLNLPLRGYRFFKRRLRRLAGA